MDPGRCRPPPISGPSVMDHVCNIVANVVLSHSEWPEQYRNTTFPGWEGHPPGWVATSSQT
jgi:hypothetical protein